MKRDVVVGRSVVIPADEIDLRFSTSGGPGGQHANRNATRVELRWNVRSTGALGPRQRARVLAALGHRLDDRGVLRLSAGRRRSQLRNIEDALDRLGALVAEALVVRPARRSTSPTASSVSQRLASKKRRSEVKKLRGAPLADD